MTDSSLPLPRAARSLPRPDRRPDLTRLQGAALTFGLALVLPGLLLLVWEYLSINKLISPILFPPPSRIFRTAITYWTNGKLIDNVLTSQILQLQGMVAGSLFGIALGLLLGLWKRGEEVIETSLIILQAIPTMAMIPLLILWLEGGQATRILVVAYSVFFPVYLGTVSAIRQVDRKLVEVGRVLGYAPAKIIGKVLLPAALPQIFTAIRQSLKMGWVGVVAAEMLIAADSGIYFMMMEARSFGQTAVVYIGLVAFALLGLFSDIVVVFLARLAMPWRARSGAED